MCTPVSLYCVSLPPSAIMIRVIRSMITDVAFHPSGHLIASCSSDRSIKIWDIRTHKLLQHYGDAHGQAEGVAGMVNSIAFGGRAGEWLVSTGGDGLVKVGRSVVCE